MQAVQRLSSNPVDDIDDLEITLPPKSFLHKRGLAVLFKSLKSPLVSSRLCVLNLQLRVCHGTAFRVEGLILPVLQTFATNLPHRVIRRLLAGTAKHPTPFAPRLQDLAVGLCEATHCPFESVSLSGSLDSIHGPPLCAAFLSVAFRPRALFFEWDSCTDRQRAALSILGGFPSPSIKEFALYIGSEEPRFIHLMTSASHNLTNSLDTLLLRERHYGV